jgi:hypothetical protein
LSRAGVPERRTAEWEVDVPSTTDHLRQLLDERPWTRAVQSCVARMPRV